MDAPGVEWVVFEYFEHGEDDLRVLAQHAQRFLCAALEDALCAGGAHPVDHVGRHPERDALGDGEQLTLVVRSWLV